MEIQQYNGRLPEVQAVDSLENRDEIFPYSIPHFKTGVPNVDRIFAHANFKTDDSCIISGKPN